MLKKLISPFVSLLSLPYNWLTSSLMTREVYISALADSILSTVTNFLSSSFSVHLSKMREVKVTLKVIQDRTEEAALTQAWRQTETWENHLRTTYSDLLNRICRPRLDLATSTVSTLDVLLDSSTEYLKEMGLRLASIQELRARAVLTRAISQTELWQDDLQTAREELAKQAAMILHADSGKT